jgi:hypothetical protein
MATGNGPITPGDRQADLADLLSRGAQIPGAAEAMKAYEELQRSMAVRVVRAQGQVTYSTGGNA